MARRQTAPVQSNHSPTASLAGDSTQRSSRVPGRMVTVGIPSELVNGRSLQLRPTTSGPRERRDALMIFSTNVAESISNIYRQRECLQCLVESDGDGHRAWLTSQWRRDAATDSPPASFFFHHSILPLLLLQCWISDVIIHLYIL